MELRRELEGPGRDLPLLLRHRGHAQGLQPLGHRRGEPLPRHLRPGPVGSRAPASFTSCATRWASSRSTGPSSATARPARRLLLFASEVRALLASGVVPRAGSTRPPWPRTCGTASWSGPDTIVEGVHLLPAASILTIKAGPGTPTPNSRQMRQYWQPAVGRGPRRPRWTSCATSSLRTVEMQLVADVPLGVFLSGGVDSSAIAALASEVAPGRRAHLHHRLRRARL